MQYFLEFVCYFESLTDFGFNLLSYEYESLPGATIIAVIGSNHQAEDTGAGNEAGGANADDEAGGASVGDEIGHAAGGMQEVQMLGCAGNNHFETIKRVVKSGKHRQSVSTTLPDAGSNVCHKTQDP